ncbi:MULTISPECIES: hypothetical protein [unclassified Streptomyces]|uniref:hypothetical protein n=1 Tax=unclassified Streptomyces TaxID=2593676 RepID=UPI003402953D
MIRTRFACLALLAAAACVAGTTPANAAPGDTLNMCASTLTPTGWVATQWWNSAGCGSGFSPNSKRIMQLTGYPVGTRVNACASTYPPAGWTITSTFYNSACRYSVVPSFDPNAWTLVRTN